jgi:hypothetical protein
MRQLCRTAWTWKVRFQQWATFWWPDRFSQHNRYDSDQDLIGRSVSEPQLSEIAVILWPMFHQSIHQNNCFPLIRCCDNLSQRTINCANECQFMHIIWRAMPEFAECHIEFGQSRWTLLSNRSAFLENSVDEIESTIIAIDWWKIRNVWWISDIELDCLSCDCEEYDCRWYESCVVKSDHVIWCGLKKSMSLIGDDRDRLKIKISWKRWIVCHIHIWYKRFIERPISSHRSWLVSQVMWWACLTVVSMNWITAQLMAKYSVFLICSDIPIDVHWRPLDKQIAPNIHMQSRRQSRTSL